MREGCHALKLLECVAEVGRRGRDHALVQCLQGGAQLAPFDQHVRLAPGQDGREVGMPLPGLGRSAAECGLRGQDAVERTVQVVIEARAHRVEDRDRESTRPLRRLRILVEQVPCLGELSVAPNLVTLDERQRSARHGGLRALCVTR